MIRKLIVVVFFLPWVVLGFLVGVLKALFSLTIEFSWVFAKKVEEKIILKTDKFVNNASNRNSREQ